MKNLVAIAVLAVMANFGAHANATFEKTFVAEIGTVSQQIKSVQLQEDGTLKIFNYENEVVDFRLSKSNAQHLLSLARSLADVEVTTTHRLVACLMMPNPFMTQQLSVLASNGTMRMILNNNICVNHDVTSPKAPIDLQNARDLKNQLVVLSRQLIND